MGTNFILFVMMLACLTMAVYQAEKVAKSERLQNIALVILSSIGLVITIFNLMLF